MRLCKCGCGKSVNEKRKCEWLRGHCNRGIIRSDKIKVPITKEMESVIFGSLLGDGTIVNQWPNTARFQETHCEKQKEYLEWKKKILQPISPQKELTYSWGKYQSYTAFLPYFKNLYQMWYRNGRKIVPKSIEEYLTPLALAVWFCDDGCKSWQSKNKKTSLGYIATYSFRQKECMRLRRAIKKNFNINARIKSVYDKRENRGIYYFLFFEVNEFQKLLKIISPLIPDCMKYKVCNV